MLYKRVTLTIGLILLLRHEEAKMKFSFFSRCNFFRASYSKTLPKCTSLNQKHMVKRGNLTATLTVFNSTRNMSKIDLWMWFSPFALFENKRKRGFFPIAIFSLFILVPNIFTFCFSAREIF